VRRSLRSAVFILFAVALAGVIAGCSKTDVKNEPVASVNGEDIKVSELREILGIRGGDASASKVPVERKKEALDRLVAGRLLAQDARVKGLDNTAEFRKALAQNEQGILITALLRREVESKGKADEKEIKAEAGKLRQADNNISEQDANARAARILADRVRRKVETDLVAAVKKENPFNVNQDLIQKIGKGEKVEDNVVLGTSGAEKVSYGDVKRLLGTMAPNLPGANDLSKNPVFIERILDRELTGKALATYAGKQGVAGSDAAKAIRKEIERSILISLLADRVVLKEVAVTDGEIGEAYKEHAQMLVRDGKKVPLSAVKEQLRGFIQNNKKKKAMEDYIGELKKKAKITVHESVLPKV
jgi:peptidyl-prolyl cis-trans isomerase C